MNYENKFYNEILISGTINYIKKLNKYIAFGLTCENYSNDKSRCYINFRIYQDLYNTYKDLFYKDNKLFVKGYLTTYSDKDNKIVVYVKVIDVSDNAKEIVNARKEPHIRYDSDGVMVWNGKRCESIPFEENDLEYLELVEMISEFE